MKYRVYISIAVLTAAWVLADNAYILNRPDHYLAITGNAALRQPESLYTSLVSYLPAARDDGTNYYDFSSYRIDWASTSTVPAQGGPTWDSLSNCYCWTNINTPWDEAMIFLPSNNTVSPSPKTIIVQVWPVAGSAAGNATIYRAGGASTANRSHFLFWNSSLSNFYYGGAIGTAATGGAFNVMSSVWQSAGLDAWTWVAGTWKSGEQKLYVNGILVASSSVVGEIWYGSPKGQYWGKKETGTDWASSVFKGNMRGLRVFNRVLTSNEIWTICK